MASEETKSGSPLWPRLLSSGYDLPWPMEVAALLLRLQLGVAICWRAGLSKFPLESWFGQQVADIGFPAPTLFAWAAAMTEVAGGVLLALGLCTRPAAFFLASTLGVAAFVYHREVPILNQHITLLYFFGYVLFLAAGSGRLSLDAALGRRGVAAGVLGLAIVAGFSGYCATRTPPPAQETVVDFSSVNSVALAGTFNGWSLTATAMSEAEPGVWVATVESTEPGPVEFKFVGNASWALAAGESDQPDERFPVAGVADPGASSANISAYLPAAGAYEFRVELPSLEYSVRRAEEASGP